MCCRNFSERIHVWISMCFFIKMTISTGLNQLLGSLMMYGDSTQVKQAI